MRRRSRRAVVVERRSAAADASCCRDVVHAADLRLVELHVRQVLKRAQRRRQTHGIWLTRGWRQAATLPRAGCWLHPTGFVVQAQRAVGTMVKACGAAAFHLWRVFMPLLHLSQNDDTAIMVYYWTRTRKYARTQRTYAHALHSIARATHMSSSLRLRHARAQTHNARHATLTNKGRRRARRGRRRRRRGAYVYGRGAPPCTIALRAGQCVACGPGRRRCADLTRLRSVHARCGSRQVGFACRRGV